jgi:hypothetical protein
MKQFEEAEKVSVFVSALRISPRISSIRTRGRRIVEALTRAVRGV